MDIREPLPYLRQVLEKRLNTDLGEYDFWHQDSHKLEEGMTLVEQCMQGEGLVYQEDSQREKVERIYKSSS